MLIKQLLLCWSCNTIKDIDNLWIDIFAIMNNQSISKGLKDALVEDLMIQAKKLRESIPQE